MAMLADEYDFVIGGDPDRDTIDLAVLDTGTGRVHAHLADTADGSGYRRMLAWAEEHSPGRWIWALEGTGSFAAGLVVFLVDAGEMVVEVGALKRAPGAKNDRIDAIRAARQALSRDEQGAPRSGGLREALRMVFACREGVLVSRTKAINELKSLIVVAPEHLRAQLRGRSLTAQLEQIELLQTPMEAPIEHRLSVFSLQSVAARVRFLSRQLAELNPQLLELIKQHPAGPALLAEAGVGPVVAAQLLISWSHQRAGPQRGGLRITGWGRSIGNKQWSTLAASPQPRRRPRAEPSTAHRRHHPHEMPPRDPRLRDPTQRPGARPTATSDARSSAHWPGASTEQSRPRQDSITPPQPLDKHRSVQRATTPVLPDLYGMSGVVVGLAARSVP